jgi:adenylate cyclase
MHFCGHMPSGTAGGPGRLRGADEQRVAAEIALFVSRAGSPIGYGSLAAGGDILIAEQILASGGELHVVLPFPAADFVHTSVSSAGEHWVERFEACLGRAASVAIATARRTGDDEAAYHSCSTIAMAAAVGRARAMSSGPVQLAVWDGRSSERIAGTAADIARWTAAGLPATIIRVDPAAALSPAAQTGPPPTDSTMP